MTRRKFAATVAGVAGILKGTARRPNVVMIMTDDHGAWATSAYGCGEMATPHIDALARGGARFTNAFACTPVCSPSRMTYLTGRLPSTHGVQDWLRPADSFGERSRKWLAGQPTYSETLAKAGYVLGMTGKWHMGDDHLAQAGFSYWATVPGGGGPYKDVEFVVNGEKVQTRGFKTDRVGDFALEFLERQRGSDKPFYLLMPTYAPHTPFDYQPEEYRAPYQSASFSCYPTGAAHPRLNRAMKAHVGNRASMHGYSALITGVDAQVGRVVRKLEEMGVRENTLIIFTADQGWNAGHHGVWGKGNGTWPFNMYEESIRVPMIWNHPGRIRAGQTPGEMISSYDYYPTILEYLGVAAPPDARRVGESYVPALMGKPIKRPERLYFEYANVRAIRTRNLKLILRTREFAPELYDLEVDPGETRNLYEDRGYARQRESLARDVERFFRRYGAPALENWRSTTQQELTVYSN